MRIATTTSLLAFAACSNLAAAASSWGFSDATLSIQGKGAGVGGGFKEKLGENKRLSAQVKLGGSDTLKLILTTQEGKTGKRPHQAFLNLKDSTSGLETSFPLSVKESGKAKVEVAYKDIPIQLLSSTKPLSVSLVIASFGLSAPYNSGAFDLTIDQESAGVPIGGVSGDEQVRYGKKPEIHHIFKADPKNPPKIISLFFTLVVVAILPALGLGWLSLGANINHVGKAFSNAPVSHTLFFGSIVAMEGVFFHVLFSVEPFPDTSCRPWRRPRYFRQWEQGFDRSPGATIGRSQVIMCSYIFM